MNLFTGRMVPSTQISIRSYCFADDDSSIHYCRSNGDAIKEYRICLCEPCTFSIDVLVPYECFLFHQTLPNRLDIFDNRGIETQIWTNLCDKYRFDCIERVILVQQVDGMQFKLKEQRFIKSSVVVFIHFQFPSFQFDVVCLNLQLERVHPSQGIVIGSGQIVMRRMNHFM